jgi:hypothetical protein
VAGSYLDVTQVHSGIEHGRDECTAQHMRVRPGDPYTGYLREPPQAPGGGVAVHPGAAAVEQDRTARAGACRLADGAPHGRRQRDQDDLGALAAHAQHLVAVLVNFGTRRFRGNYVMDVATRPRRPEAPGSRQMRTFAPRGSMHKNTVGRSRIGQLPDGQAASAKSPG